MIKIFKLGISVGVVITFLLLSCSIQPVNKSRPKDKVIKNTFDLTGKYDVKMRIEIEYAVSEKGYLNNECTAQYILTNMSTIPYSTRRYSMDIVFEFTTSDDKVFEVKKRINNDIQPGNSDEASKVQLDVGLNRFCVSVKPVRIVSND